MLRMTGRGNVGEGLLVRSVYSVPKNSNSWSAPYSDKARLVPTFRYTKKGRHDGPHPTANYSPPLGGVRGGSLRGESPI